MTIVMPEIAEAIRLSVEAAQAEAMRASSAYPCEQIVYRNAARLLRASVNARLEMVVRRA